jgi:hypothetical protein
MREEMPGARVSYTKSVKPHDCARFGYLLSALLPEVRRVTPGLAGGAFVCVAYPDSATMQRHMPFVGASKRAWMPYALVHTQSIVDRRVLPHPSSLTVVIAVGHYDPHGHLLAAHMEWQPGYWSDPAVYSGRVNVARTLSTMAFDDEMHDASATLHRVRTRCAHCHVAADDLSVCAGCDAVRYCSLECTAMDSARHAIVCATVRALVARADAEDAASEATAAASEATAAASESAASDEGADEGAVEPLTMASSGIFNDAVRNRLLWDVTKPPCTARVMPSCISPLLAWRRASSAPLIDGRFLDAKVAALAPPPPPPMLMDFAPAPQPTRVRIVLPELNVVAHVQVGATVRELMLAVHAAAAKATVRDTEHRRFDMLQTTAVASSFRVRLGGNGVWHRAIGETGCRLYDAVF